MKTPPLVADVAPTEAALTDYDKRHMITDRRVFDADNKAPTGVKSVGSCCASTQTPSRTVRGLHSKAIYLVRDG